MTKILVVEDDSDIRELLVDTLLDMDYEVIEAAHGGLGLKMAIDESPDIVLLDVMMPVMDGFQVLESLKERLGPGCPLVIMVSAKGQEQDVLNATRKGAWGYVTKPWELGELVSVLKSAEMQIQTRQAVQGASGEDAE